MQKSKSLKYEPASEPPYRGTSLIRNRHPVGSCLGSYGGPRGGGGVLMALMQPLQRICVSWRLAEAGMCCPGGGPDRT